MVMLLSKQKDQKTKQSVQTDESVTEMPEIVSDLTNMEFENDSGTSDAIETKPVQKGSKTILMKPPNVVQDVSSWISGEINSMRHKCFLRIISESNSERTVKAKEYQRCIVAKGLTIAKVTEPKINLRTGARIFYTTDNANHTVKVCEKSIAYYNNIKQLHSERIIPDMFGHATQYKKIEEINKAKKKTKQDVLIILLAIGLGFGLASLTDTITGNDGGDDITVNGNYNENNSQTTNNDNNDDNNNNNNNNPVVIP